MKKLVSLTIVILTCHYHVIRTQFVTSHIQTVPLWDTNSTVQMCQVEHLVQDGVVNFQGNPYHGCNLQVLASPNTRDDHQNWKLLLIDQKKNAFDRGW